MKLLAGLRWCLEPSVAVVWLTLWIAAEAGRGVTELGVLVAFAIAIGLARLSWIASVSVLAATLIASLSGVLHPLQSTDWPAYQAIGMATGLVWASARPRARLLSAVAGAVLTVAAVGSMFVDGWMSWVGLRSVGAGFPLGSWLVALVAFGLGWLGGCLVVGWVLALAEGAVRREQTVLQDRLEVTETELVLIAERERVAQEVHDVVAHSLAVILAQAQGARALSAKRPAAMADALDRIADASRSALLDVRGIVDGLTGGDEPPQPTIDDLPALLHVVEEAGITVRTTSAGEPHELGAAPQVAVYRIVQEGATNALRHRGRGSTLDVVLDWRGPGLSIQLVSSGTGDAVPAPGAGRGIAGMTDRARVAGGWLAAGADESGDHRITAFIPYRFAADPVPA